MTDSDDTAYRITGLGLHRLGFVTDEGLIHFKHLEHRLEDQDEIIDEYDTIITFLLTQINYIADADSLDQARELADDAITQIQQVPIS